MLYTVTLRSDQVILHTEYNLSAIFPEENVSVPMSFPSPGGPEISRFEIEIYELMRSSL